MKNALTATLCITAAGLIMTGCVTTPRPSPPPPPPVDMLMDVASRATQELLKNPVVTGFEAKNKRKPLIEAGPVANATRARIAIEQVSERVMDALLDSNQVDVMATNMTADRPPDYFLDGLILGQENTYTFQLRMNEVKTATRAWGRSYTIRYDAPKGNWNIDL